jgi:sorbitol/mannitol transport system permease protein
MSSVTARAAAGPDVPEAAPERRWLLMTPAVGLLLLWMIVPLAMTLWFSFQCYNLLNPAVTGFAGFENYEFLVTDPNFWTSLVNTLVLVGSVLVITVGLGTLLAVLFGQPFLGSGIARVLAISPFFVMPTVSALVWKNLMMHPIYGVLGALAHALGLPAVDWFAEYPMLSVIITVAW